MASSNPPPTSSLLDRPRTKPPSRHTRAPVSLALFDSPPPPPQVHRQASLPLSLPTSPSKRPPLGSILPRSANEVRRQPRGEEEEEEAGTNKARGGERRRSISASALASLRGVMGGGGGILGIGKKKSSSSLRAQGALRRGREEGGGSSTMIDEERSLRTSSTLLPLLKTSLQGSKDLSFSDSLELAFDEVSLSNSPPASSPPAHAPAQAPPSPSFSTTTHSTSIYLSCNSSILGSSSSSSSAHTVVAPNSPLLPCCVANRLALPYHLRSNKLDLNRSGSSTTSGEDETTPKRGGGGGGGGGPSTETPREGDASTKWSPSYVREWSPSSGDSPCFAIGDNPTEGKAREKLISRGIVPWKSLVVPQTAAETRRGTVDVEEEKKLSPFYVGDSVTNSLESTSLSLPMTRNTLEPSKPSPSSSSHQTRTRTPSPLQFTSTNSVELEASHYHSNSSSVSSTYSQSSFVAGAIVSPHSPKSDDEQTERDDSSLPSSALPTPFLPTSPLPDGLQYDSASPRMEEKSTLPMSPPLSADSLAQSAESPYGAFSWARGGPESPDGGMGWLFRRGEAETFPAEDRGGGEEEEERSEAENCEGYLGEEEVSFATSDGSLFDALASPSARFSALNRMAQTPPQSPTHRIGSDSSSSSSSVQGSPSDSETANSFPRPLTRRSFVRESGAPSPSPTKRDVTSPSSSISNLDFRSLALQDNAPSSSSSPFSSTHPRRPTSRPLPPIPQPQPQLTPMTAAPRVRPRSNSRPRSMHEQIHRALSTAPVTKTSSSGLFVPHALTPIEGSPSSLFPQGTPPTTTTNGGIVSRRSALLEGGTNGSPLAGKRRDLPSLPSLVGDREREGWGDVNSELKALVGYGKIQESIRKLEDRQQQRERKGPTVPTLRRTKRRKSLLGEEGLWGGVAWKANGEAWPSVMGGGQGSEGGLSRRGSVEVRSTKTSDFGGGSYLRRLEPSEVTPLAEGAPSTTIKKRPSASSLKALFERRPSLSNVLDSSTSAGTSLSESTSSLVRKPRSLSFTHLLSSSKRRCSPSPSPSPSPSIDAFDFEESTESLFEEAKKNKRFF